MARRSRRPADTFTSSHEHERSAAHVHFTHVPLMIVLVVLRTIVAATIGFLATTIGGLAAIIAGLFGVEDREGGIFDHTPRVWSRIILWAAGVKTRRSQPGADGRRRAATSISSNHLSWFDIPALASVLAAIQVRREGGAVQNSHFRPGDPGDWHGPHRPAGRKSAFVAYDVAAGENSRRQLSRCFSRRDAWI